MSTKEFNYTREWTDAEAFPLLSFTKNWENPSDYPTIETDEQKVRQDMQSLHDEVKNFLNNELIPRVVEEDATVDAWRASEETRVTNEETRVANEEQRVANEEHRKEVTRDAEAAVVAVENLTADYVELPAGSPVYVEKSVNAEGGIQLIFGLSRGTSGVYVGSGTMPDDANIQIDPTGDPTDTAGLMMTKTYDPTGKAQDVFAYVDNAVGNIPTPDVSGQINTHNTSGSAHSDIRTLASNAQNTANAAQEAVAAKAPMYTYGTTDLTAGSSPLATGQLHFVYE
jgi:hypothetical protein